MRARVTVTLKAGVLDPQGKAIEAALASLGIEGVAGVRQGKLFDIELVGHEAPAAQATLRQACERLLANTVIENYAIEIEERPVAERQAPPTDGPATGETIARPAPPQPPDADGGAPPRLDPTAATEAAARDAEMPTEGHP